MVICAALVSAAQVSLTVDPDCRPRAFLLHRRMAAPRTPQNNVNPLPEPPPVSEAMALAHKRYWRFNVVLISVLMMIGLIVSFGVPLLARELGDVRFAGFSLPFYVGAQGAILVYVLLTAIYIVLMQYADRTLQAAREADQAIREASKAQQR
jgi:putative solute:sodium symporter small subunit